MKNTLQHVDYSHTRNFCQSPQTLHPVCPFSFPNDLGFIILSLWIHHFLFPENLVGEGGNSYVYRGDLPDGRELAVKILKPCLDVLKEFILEIEVITSVHHKNIVSLFGFCFEDNNLMLVYDYLPRGSLEENLHGI